MSFNRTRLKEQVALLASQDVYIGTSSWKYPGWCGSLYDPGRYAFRGRFSKARFDRECLCEYAEVFKTVSVDAAYYTFPSERYLAEVIAQVPADFLFTFKVTDAITIKRFPRLARFGKRAGASNQDFLNSELFAEAFLHPCEPFRRNIGLLLFEFSRFGPHDYACGRDFIMDLDVFLARLPRSWSYGVEIRNTGFLHRDYFACLARHNVSHVFNNWYGMPTVAEQLALDGSRTHSQVRIARFLLKPGRTFSQAVDLFSPYTHVKEVNETARATGTHLIQEGMAASGERQTFIYVGNRLEGNGPATIAAML